MRRFLVLAVSCVATIVATPVHAFDPVTLMVLRLVRDQVISAGLEAGLQPGPSAHDDPVQRPTRQQSGGRDLRATIDDGFPYLDRAQRDAVYERLKAALADPQYAGSRAAILQELASKASAAREAHEALAKLPWERKRAIAKQVAEAYGELSGDERQALVDALRRPALPLPADLRELMLADIASGQPPAVLSR